MAVRNEEIIEWLEGQSVWFRDAVKTYYEIGEFTEKDIKRFAKECIDEASGKKKKIDLSGLNLLYRDDRRSFSIKSVGDIKGVNALAQGKELSFGSTGITVIYGENGAGKSGYIRIIKKLADAKYKEDLKGNVYKTGKSRQSCRVTIESNGEEEVLDCNLSKDGEYSVLRDIDIFDTRIATAYIDDANEASYEPWIFLLFRELATAATLVKKELDDSKRALETYEVKIDEELVETSVGKALCGITAKSVFEESFFSWDVKNDIELGKKEKEANLDVIKGNISRLENEIKQLKGIRDYFNLFVPFFSEEYVSTICTAKQALIDAEKELAAAQIIFSEEASVLDKESISNSAWKAIWIYAKEYYETLLKEKGVVRYTEESGLCPLCGQNIPFNYVQRVKTVDEYINGNVSQKASNAKKKYFELLKKCPRAWADEQMKLSLDACDCGTERTKIETCANAILSKSSIINSDEIENAEIEVINVAETIKVIDGIISAKKATKKANEELSQDDDHKALIKEIVELKARKYAASVKNRVFSRIEYLKLAKIYDDAIKLTATNKISTKSKLLGEELLTEDYIRRFNDELKTLTKGGIKASLKQQKVSKGKVPFKIVLEGATDDKANPTDVFSEGEKRVVSLAAFFAESSGRSLECPLIVDDPISSLDYKFEAAVIRRLVNAGKKRQVIVFTHRLSMVVGLHDACDSIVPFEERELRGYGDEKGVPMDNAFIGGKSLSKLKNLKNEKIAQLKNKDKNSDEYADQVHRICQEIRIYVEKSVEETLINGVVQRYRKEIRTGNGMIMKLSQITADDCKIIDDMMTKYSYYDHSMSDEAPLQEFTIEEIEEDVDRLINWLTEFGKRKEA